MYAINLGISRLIMKNWNTISDSTNICRNGKNKEHREWLQDKDRIRYHIYDAVKAALATVGRS